MDKKKPVLLISSDNFIPRFDGISKFLEEIVNSLKDKFDIVVVTVDHGKVSNENYKLYQFPYKFKVGEFPVAKVNKKLVRKLVSDADIVFNNTIGPVGFNVVLEAKRQKKPVVGYLHSRDWELFSTYLNFNKFFKFFIEYFTLRRLKKVLSSYSLILVPSKEDSLLLLSYGIKKPSKILPLGVNPFYFKPFSNKYESKEAVGLNPKNFVVGFVGRLSYEKDINTLVRSFFWLKKNFSNVTLLIVGSGLKKIEDSLKNKNGIVHVKATPFVLQYYHAMDVFVMPSLTETTSIATIEAMSTSIPVVVSNTGLMKFYVKNNYNGFVFPKKDWMALSRYLKKLYEDPILRKTLGENARKTVLNNFNINNTIKELEKIFNTFLE